MEIVSFQFCYNSPMIQYPLKSASAVYKARGMYGIVEPFTRFDNYSICDSQGMQYRLAQENEKKQALKKQEMYLFPNPSNHVLNIELTNNTGMVHYQITNTLGQIILSWENENLQQVLNLINLGLSNGLYYVQAKSADGKAYQQKFVYQKQ